MIDKGWHKTALAAALLLAFVCLFFPQQVTGEKVFWGADLTRLMYPLVLGLSECIRQGNFSSLIWNSDIYAGFPLLAEGQVGAFHPLSWIFLLILPPVYALNYSLISCYVLTAFFTFWFARLVGLNYGGALFASVAFTFGGFTAGQLTHVNIMRAVPLSAACILFFRVGV